MEKILLSISFLFLMKFTQAQSLPYYEIPEAPKEYTAGTVTSRTIDGLGFRYYWATQGLTEKDLVFKPNEEARTSLETVKHILDLSVMTLSAVTGDKLVFPKKDMLSFVEMRKTTLHNFKKASNILKASKDISIYVMKLNRGNGKVEEYEFWNQLNGPISDAIWHCGQLVSFRRSSGNPFPKGVSLLTGKVKK